MMETYSSQFWRLESKIGVWVWLGSGENPLLDCRPLTSCCTLTWGKGRGSPWGPFNEGTNSTQGGHQPHDLRIS